MFWVLGRKALGMWDLSSSTRDRKSANPVSEGKVLTTGLPGRYLNYFFIWKHFT